MGVVRRQVEMKRKWGRGKRKENKGGKTEVLAPPLFRPLAAIFSGKLAEVSRADD